MYFNSNVFIQTHNINVLIIGDIIEGYSFLVILMPVLHSSSQLSEIIVQSKI